MLEYMQMLWLIIWLAMEMICFLIIVQDLIIGELRIPVEEVLSIPKAMHIKIGN
jgi:hypothetical protein